MKYTTYAIKRILLVIPMFIGASFLLWFSLVYLFNGNPLSPYVRGIELMKLTTAQRQALMHKYGLDQPWYIRYLRSISGILSGNWGKSFIFGNVPVFPLVVSRFSATAEVSILSLIIALIIGIPIGIRASLANGKKEIYLTSSTLIGYSIPAFISAMFIQSLISEFFVYIAYRLHINALYNYNFSYGRFNTHFFKYPQHLIFGLPTTGFLTIDSLFSLNILLFFDTLMHLIGPVTVVTLAVLPIIVKMTQAAMRTTLKQDYILLAKSKGLTERTILYRHALKNALIPLMTIGGVVFSTVLLGSIYCDVIFEYPGMGSLLYKGINLYDMPTIQGFMTIAIVVFILFNLVVDLAYGYIDPRIRI